MSAPKSHGELVSEGHTPGRTLFGTLQVIPHMQLPNPSLGLAVRRGEKCQRNIKRVPALGLIKVVSEKQMPRQD